MNNGRNFSSPVELQVSKIVTRFFDCFAPETGPSANVHFPKKAYFVTIKNIFRGIIFLGYLKGFMHLIKILKWRTCRISLYCILLKIVSFFKIINPIHLLRLLLTSISSVRIRPPLNCIIYPKS
jgi:hypothetical protein